MVLASAIDSDYKGEIVPLFHSAGKEEYVWNIRDPLPCPVIKTQGKPPQHDPGRPTNSPDPLMVMVWVTTPSKESQPVESKGNTEWVEEEEESYKYQL